MNHPDRKRKIAIAIALVLLLLAGGCIVWTRMPKRAEAPAEPVTQAVHDYTEPLPAQDNKPDEADDNTKGSDSDSVGTEDDDASGDQNAQGANQQGSQSAGTTPAAPATPQQTTDANTQPQAPTQPAAQHQHSWAAVYKTVHHNEVGHFETVVVKDAWDEEITEEKKVPDYGVYVCNCGASFTSADALSAHKFSFVDTDAEAMHSSSHTEIVYKTVYETRTVHHDPVSEQRWIIDKAAYDKQVIDYYTCSCGARK